MGFIDGLRGSYQKALAALDDETKQLVNGGKDFAAVLVSSAQVSEIMRIHDELHAYYSLLFNHIPMLERHRSRD